MPSQKGQKIDFNAEYPCPCRRRGRLQPIVLTEALGCSLCQRIFVVEEEGRSVEELSTNYPYKRRWSWTGNRWLAIQAGTGYGYFRLLFGIFMLLALISLILALHSSNLIFIIFFGLLVSMMLLLIFGLAYRP